MAAIDLANGWPVSCKAESSSLPQEVLQMDAAGGFFVPVFHNYGAVEVHAAFQGLSVADDRLGAAHYHGVARSPEEAPLPGTDVPAALPTFFGPQRLWRRQLLLSCYDK